MTFNELPLWTFFRTYYSSDVCLKIPTIPDKDGDFEFACFKRNEIEYFSGDGDDAVLTNITPKGNWNYLLIDAIMNGTMDYVFQDKHSMISWILT
jgi:hypothetical protein